MKKSKIIIPIIMSFLILIGCSDAIVNSAPIVSDQEFTVPEDAVEGLPIGTVEASDADGDSFTFSIVGGNDEETFQLDSETGELSLNKALDFEMTSSYEIDIQVADDQSTNTAVISILVTDVLETGLFDLRFQFDDLQREYLLYIPESYTVEEPFPVVFSLHGAAGTKESQFELSEFNLLANRENFILVTPEATALVGPITFWNRSDASEQPDDVGFLEALLDEIIGEYTVDLDRIYFAGSSNGGGMALECACQMSDRIAAVAAVKGYILPDQITACNPSKPTAIIQMHGTEDPLAPYSEVEATIQYWNSFNKTDTASIVTTLPDIDPNNGNIAVRYLYSNGTNGVEVQHIQVINGVHDWFGEPGTNYDFNASEEAWAFFKRFDRNGLR